MQDTKTSPQGRFQDVARRHRWMVGAALLGLTGLAYGAGGGGPESPQQQAQVEDLVVCYARGTDTLGSATDAVVSGGDLDSTINLSDPQFVAGLEFYRECFSDDFSFTLEFDGVPALTVPDPATRTPDTDAALQWANFVNDAFRGPGYQSTQHMMGSISSEIDGATAHVESYLIATHVYGPTSGKTGVYRVTGTYTDHVVKERGEWVIEARTLNITSSVDLLTLP